MTPKLNIGNGHFYPLSLERAHDYLGYAEGRSISPTVMIFDPETLGLYSHDSEDLFRKGDPTIYEEVRRTQQQYINNRPPPEHFNWMEGRSGIKFRGNIKLLAIGTSLTELMRLKEEAVEDTLQYAKRVGFVGVSREDTRVRSDNSINADIEITQRAIELGMPLFQLNIGYLGHFHHGYDGSSIARIINHAAERGGKVYLTNGGAIFIDSLGDIDFAGPREGKHSSLFSQVYSRQNPDLGYPNLGQVQEAHGGKIYVGAQSFAGMVDPINILRAVERYPTLKMVFENDGILEWSRDPDVQGEIVDDYRQELGTLAEPVLRGNLIEFAGTGWGLK